MSAQPAGRSTTRRVLLGTAAGLLIVILAIVGVATWVMNTNAGTRWALRIASNVLDDALQVRQITGTLTGPLTLEGLNYRDPKTALAFSAQYISVDLGARDLLRAQLTVQDLDVRGVRVALGAPQEEEPSEPFSLQPPIDMRLDRLQLADAIVQRDGQTLVQIDSAAAAGAWTDAGVNLRQLDVRSPQGEIHFQAALSGTEVYFGEGAGRFRWQVGERSYAGTLQAQAQDAAATLNLQLTSPLTARVKVDVEQSDSVPWKLTLEVPTFDPSDELMPGSSLRSLAAALNGTGDLTRATLDGSIVINDEPVQLERIHMVRRQETIDLQAAIKLTQGVVQANGAVMLADAPTAQLDVNWQDVVIPEQWAGQVLHSQGQLHFNGGAESYVATGALRLGPPQRLADIRLDAQGSPQFVELRQLDIAQAAGTLKATGRIDLQPAIAWRANAQARRFNPGEFAADWQGSLNFDLQSDGRLSEAGPAASLKLDGLNGRLRGRNVNGRADLRLSPDKVLAGVMDVNSGGSRIRVQGERGEVMSAVATIDIPALNDWLPDAGGALHGRVTASGRWPQLQIGGRIRGSTLRIATTRVEALALSFDISQPTDPRGEAALEATQITAGGFIVDRLQVSAAGDAGRHTLQLDTTGQPLAAHLRLHGARTSQAPAFGWAGTLDELVLDVKDAANLQLQRPVEIAYAQNAVRVSQACFADGDIRLCLEGNSEPDGALQARYSLKNVPLALANTFAPAAAALALSGTLDGEGNIARDAQGRLNGMADVRSARGQIARRLDPAAESPEVLLTYANLRIAANLEGSDGNGSIAMQLNDAGRLQGDLALSGLGGATTGLRGKLDASLPSIGVVEVFAPQLANVRGAVQLSARVGGTLDTPRIEGELNATGLATDVPALGLKLHDGRLQVTPRRDGEFTLAGSVASGKGTLRFDGVAATAGSVQMDIQGQQFLAADIPGAMVIVEPKMKFTRGAQQMSLQGNLHIPSAKIDLQKLPRTQSTQNHSSDVVIVDAKTQEEAQQEAIPLQATLDVTLGDEVSLVGFGLDAKVAGQLLVREAPGAPTTGSGEVRVAGTYKAYGQDLTIRQGQLLFAGTPLDNPNLSIVAVREADPVVAGLRIQGSARNPQLTVFSEPPMAQSNALAYLVTGKPLSDVGSGEGDLVQSAARSLGTAAGGLLAKNIGRRLGVDEVGIKDSEAIGGAALTVGQYLSPRLYLSYGVGLFEPGEVVTLRYKLSEQLSLEALNGPKDSRAGVEYRIEK
jgi:translocation and assembly module TamB